jgi:hypothetical protein
VNEKQPEPGAWPERDDVNDEDGPHTSQNMPPDSAQDARRTERRDRSQDVDPDSAESSVDRDDMVGDGA